MSPAVNRPLIQSVHRTRTYRFFQATVSHIGLQFACLFSSRVFDLGLPAWHPTLILSLFPCISSGTREREIEIAD